ncbi:MAG: transcriptional repressor [Acidimicrobiales bacterium]
MLDKLRAEGQCFYTSGRRQPRRTARRAQPPSPPTSCWRADPGLTQSSVYRNLAVLEEVGIVQKVASSDDRARFELAEDLIGHHHHLICVACGRVDDFVVPARTEKTLDAALERVVSSTGFVAAGHRLDIIGTCAACA